LCNQPMEKWFYKSHEAPHKILHLNRKSVSVFRHMEIQMLEKPPIETITFEDSQNEL
jgi:hypothetical protein